MFKLDPIKRLSADMLRIDSNGYLYRCRRGLMRTKAEPLEAEPKRRKGLEATKRLESNDSHNWYQNKFESFEEMIAKEKTEAKSYLVIEDKSRAQGLSGADEAVVSELIGWKVTEMFKYTIGRRNLALIRVEDYPLFREKTKLQLDDQIYPIRSRLLQISDFPKGLLKANRAAGEEVPKRVHKHSQKDLVTEIRRLSVASEAISHLVSGSSMTKWGCKLRFFLINQLEELLCAGAFGEFVLHPFGSSVNGFGNDASDLDVLLCLRTEQTKGSLEMNRAIAYQGKRLPTDRVQMQRFVNTMADLLENFVPGVSNCLRIARARVPIVKFYSEATGLDVDLSLASSTAWGVKMATILYTFSKMSPRLRELIIFTKLWAKTHGLTSHTPGFLLTNFMFMTLATHFLQTYGTRLILPPIRDIGIGSKPRNTGKSRSSIERLEEPPFELLLQQFFHYLATFDYKNYGLSIYDGTVIVKPAPGSLYIENPLQRELNVAQNVSLVELGRLIRAAEISYIRMDRANCFLANLLEPFGSSEDKHSMKNSGLRFASSQKGIKIDDFLDSI